MEKPELSEAMETLLPFFEAMIRKQHRVTIAAAALQGLLAKGFGNENAANSAVSLADYMLGQLEGK
jgi:hypothetical protein